MDILRLNGNANVPTSFDVAVAVEAIVSDVESNRINALCAYGQLAAVEHVVEDAKKRLREMALEQFAEDEREKIAYGAKFIKRNVNVRYDYSIDEEWSARNLQVSDLTSQQKEREQFLRESNAVPKRSSMQTVLVTLTEK